jgi:hypothetical protein
MMVQSANCTLKQVDSLLLCASPKDNARKEDPRRGDSVIELLFEIYSG